MTESNPQPKTGDSATKKLIVSTGIGIAVAVVVLFLFVLPAEYGIDPTGAGRAFGLTQMREPTRSFEIVNVVGGNETLREVEIPDFGQPVPLPNPDVYQDESEVSRSDTLELTIPAEGETEVKTVLQTGKVIIYSWRTDRGTIYSDFHGHDPEAGAEFWVRYREHQEGSSDNGSLVAPFSGEHGWYWLNYNEYPVTVTLTLHGYYDDIIDYSELF